MLLWSLLLCEVSSGAERFINPQEGHRTPCIPLWRSLCWAAVPLVLFESSSSSPSSQESSHVAVSTVACADHSISSLHSWYLLLAYHLFSHVAVSTGDHSISSSHFWCLSSGLPFVFHVLQSAQATTASAARILPSGPSDPSLPQPNGTAAMDEDDDMGVPGPSSSRPASAGQGRAGSRPPTAPESARRRQATLGEAFGRSGRSTQQVGFSSRLPTAASVLQNKQGAGISKNLGG